MLCSTTRSPAIQLNRRLGALERRQNIDTLREDDVSKKAISGMPVQGFMCNFYELVFGVYIVLPDGTGEGKLWFLTVFRQDSLKNRR